MRNDDNNFRGQAYAVMVRSPIAHGTLRGVNTGEAREMPGVLGIWAGADLKDVDYGPITAPITLADGAFSKISRRFPLATDKVRYVGDPVAIVVADTLHEAQNSAHAITVDIEPLVAVHDPRAAAGSAAPQLFDDVPGNVCQDYYRGDYNATARAFANAARVIQLRLTNTGSEVVADEVPKALANYVASKIERPIKWANNNSPLAGERASCAFDFDCQLALDKEGIFLAVRLRGFASIGGCVASEGSLMMPAALSRHLATVYRTPLIEVSCKSVLTNARPLGADDSAGSFIANYVMERLVDQVARAMRTDGVALRKANFARLTDLPCQTSTSAGGHGLTEHSAFLDKAVLAAEISGFANRKEASVRSGKHRGLGIGNYCERVKSSTRERCSHPSRNPSGAHITEVEIDPETGTIDLVKYTVVNEFGLFVAAERGEEAVSGSLPSFMNAVVDALGGRHIDMPATPERVWRVLRTVPMLGLY